MDHEPAPVTLSAAARETAVIAAEYAPQAENDRRLHPEVVKSLLEAGFARHFVPSRLGGAQGTFLELNRAVSAVGEACAATAWCASLSAHVSRMAAHLPVAGQEEIWADGPDPLLVASLTPLGRAVPVAGGYRLTGVWPFVSAIDHADWALLAALVSGDGEPEPYVFAVPRGSWETSDTWRNVGMAATGSNTVTVTGLTVPAVRAMSRADLFTGRAPSTAACHAVPMQATTMMFATPALGAAKGALQAWTAHVTPRIRSGLTAPAPALPGMPGFNRAAYDVTLARSAGEIDAAELLLDRAASTADSAPGLTPLQVMRNWRDCALATESLVGVVNRLFRGVGTTGQSLMNPVQRFWRDANSLAGHQALQVESASTAYSLHALEL